MESLSKEDESRPTPQLYYFQDQSQTSQEARMEHPDSYSGLVLPLSFSTQAHSPLPGSLLFSSAPPPPTPKLRFVSYETELHRSPALTTCYSCQTQVITQVTYKVGRHVWLMCLALVLFGLVLGCCLVPFFLKHFKDAHHSCPLCRRVLYVHKKTCGA